MVYFKAKSSCVQNWPGGSGPHSKPDLSSHSAWCQGRVSRTWHTQNAVKWKVHTVTFFSELSSLKMQVHYWSARRCLTLGWEKSLETLTSVFFVTYLDMPCLAHAMHHPLLHESTATGTECSNYNHLKTGTVHTADRVAHPLSAVFWYRFVSSDAIMVEAGITGTVLFVAKSNR